MVVDRFRQLSHLIHEIEGRLKILEFVLLL